VRVIVCGSRGWSDRQRIADRLFDLPSGTTIVVGYDPDRDTPDGADRISYQEAQKLGLAVESHPYRPFIEPGVSGKRAPLVRNEHMASLGADLCIAFWDGRSSGTAHMMEIAAKYGIPIDQQHKDFPNRERVA
jgi:hypothetical protein